MKTTRKYFIYLSTLLFASIAGSALITNCQPKPRREEAVKQSPANVLSWTVPVNPEHNALASQTDYYNFAWQTFIAINWPANSAYRGMPDSTLTPGAKDANGNYIPVVWEAWQEQYQIFLPYAQNPGIWNEPDTGCSGAQLGLKRLRMFSKSNGHEVFDAFNEATGQPLIDQDSQFVRYEVRVNEAEYTYFINNTYYNADSQIVAVSQNRFVGFPNGTDTLSQSLSSWARFGATEVKASWRVFTNSTPGSVKSRYYVTKAILTDSYGNCTDTAEVGLIGLHILRLTPHTGSSWYWASFEHVDNLKLQSQYGGTLPPHPTFNTNPAVIYGDSGFSYQPPVVNPGSPMPPAIPVGVSSPPFLQSNVQLDSINNLYAGYLQNTPFRYYQLVGTVNPPSPNQQAIVDSAQGVPSVNVNTPWLANSTMETYIVNSNCVTCHIHGFPQMPKNMPKTSGLQVFTFLPSLAQTTSSKLDDKKHNSKQPLKKPVKKK